MPLARPVFKISRPPLDPAELPFYNPSDASARPGPIELKGAAEVSDSGAGRSAGAGGMAAWTGAGALPVSEGLDQPLFLPWMGGRGKVRRPMGLGDTRLEKEQQTWTGTDERRLALGGGTVLRTGWHLPTSTHLLSPT